MFLRETNVDYRVVLRISLLIFVVFDLCHHPDSDVFFGSFVCLLIKIICAHNAFICCRVLFLFGTAIVLLFWYTKHLLKLCLSSSGTEMLSIIFIC